MEIKLFGKSIFEFNKNKGSYYFINSQNKLKESEFLPDFYTLKTHTLDEYVVEPEQSTSNFVAVPIKKKETKIKITPKGIYEMKMLNDKSFKMNVDKEYVENQLQQFKDKLSLIKVTENDMTRGITEISSILIRLENRKKYVLFKDFFEKYPYTTPSKIANLIEKHSYLKIGQVEQFLADMPNEAVKEMKEYEAQTKTLCKKKPVFYIIADKEDFKKSEKRRDPILLAQSPFGHVWQILGVWDKEMLVLEQL